MKNHKINEEINYQLIRNDAVYHMFHQSSHKKSHFKNINENTSNPRLQPLKSFRSSKIFFSHIKCIKFQHRADSLSPENMIESKK